MEWRRLETDEETRKRYGEAPDKAMHARMRWVMWAFLVLFGAVGIRLGFLHLNPRLELTQEEKLHIGKRVLRETRGEIFDRNGLFLAMDRQVPSLWVDPREVKDPQGLAGKLQAKLGIDPKELTERMTQRDQKGNLQKFVWVKRWLEDAPESFLREIEDFSEGAVSVQYESVRFYPQRDTAAHLLGFVNRAGEASEGLELTFNDYLKSEPGNYTARKDSGRRLLDSLTLEYTPPKGGDSVQLTLDTDIQHTLERALDTRMEETKALGAMGVVMNPNTGAVLALATRPAFDPNKYDDFPPELRKNAALIDVFEPGSSFKIVTASAALENGLVTPDTMINCEGGTFNPYGHTVRDFHKMGVEPFRKCFEESSNIAMIKVGAMLGPERLNDWIQRYGFGKRTSRDFQLESPGIFPKREKWSRLTMGSLPMGQEIAVTMIQLGRAFSVIANGGYLVEPYFVERALSRNGDATYQHQRPERVRILSPNTVKTMQELCHLVILHGTGKDALIPEYRAGGKTGTAQIANPNGGGYKEGAFTAVFAGFAPVANPQLVVVIVVKEPAIRLHFGGYVCGPVFKEVMRDSLVRLNVPEDPVLDENGQRIDEKGKKKEKEPEKIASTDKKTKTAPAKPVEADAESEDVDTVSERSVEDKFAASLDQMVVPLAGAKLAAHSVDGIDRATPLPDFTGMTKRQALEKLRTLGLPWDQHGVGWVVSQDPPAGTPVGDVVLCSLEFSNRKTAPEAQEQKHDEKRTM